MVKAIQIQHNEIMEKAFSYAKSAGFEYVSLGFGSSKAFHGDGWEKETLRIKSLLDKYGLKCVQTHLPYYSLKIDSSVIDEQFEIAIERCIRATAMLGGKCTAMHLRSAFDRDFSSSLAREDNIKAVRRYIKTAKDSGVVIALENLPIFPWDTTWRFYSYDYEELISLCDSFESENVKICWDFGHASLTGTDQKRALSLVEKRLVCTHIHDNFGNDDHHLIPGTGIIKWNDIMPVLGDIKYGGPLTLEIDYKDGISLEAYIKLAYLRLSELEEMIGR